ncbi:hypothetical protein C464_03532 [Halorubrum coriense DSM 10284]|uniref:Uncharacterized protein n=1 Tax=Halorubrum coriense DSM 10284 TaxID=1227466 RepID=M0EUD4_9EURY|nr:hypothetical protein [Halorubrum coriense]ELZ50019.1 hypothetical protein C464_03532 [Halorubrum coriense DSM 10284]
MPSESGTSSTPEEAVELVDSGEVPADSHGDRDAPETAAERDPVEWGPVRHERLRSLATGASVAILGAILVLVTGAAAGLLVGVASGDVAVPSVGAEAIAVGVALLLAFLIGTVPVLYAVYRESSVGEPSVARLREAASALRPGWTLAGLGAVVAAAVALPTDVLPALWPLFWVAWLVPAAAESSGVVVCVDPAERTVARTYPSHDRTRSDDLGAVVRTRRIDTPWTTVFLLAYRGNAWFRSTPWLFAPRDRADEVESALDAALAEGDGPDRASVPERLTLAVLGSFSLVVGLLMAVAAGEGAGGVALALLTAPFSLLFLALAARL